MPEKSDQHEGGTFQSFRATYCEWCGHLKSASEEIEERVNEPAHRVGIIGSLGDIGDVVETVAIEVGSCPVCDGQLVKRYYATGEVPDPGCELSDKDFAGRDPHQDSLVNLGDSWIEAREMPEIEEGSKLD